MNKTSLNRFFSNQCSPVEREEIIRWLLDPSNDLLIKHWLREHWDTLSVNELVADQDEPDMEKIWGKIRSSIKENQLKSGLEKAPSGFNKFHFDDKLMKAPTLVRDNAQLLQTSLQF